MIAHIRGTLTYIDATSAVIDVNGVGFKLGMSTTSLSALGPVGSEVTVYTSMIVRDDALDLYAFIDSQEREAFERLLAVSGVGPKLALSTLSSFTPDTLQQLISEEDVKRLTSVSGMGKKTAQRLILELQGTLVNVDKNSQAPGSQPSAGMAQAAEALLGMGFTRAEVDLALGSIDEPPDDVSELLRLALQKLGGAP